MKRIGFISMLLAAVIAIFHGCQEAPLEEVKISLNKSLLVLEKGQTEKLSPTITPSSAAVDLTWSSADNSVAKVSTDGDVTGVAAGETVITVSAGEAKATCKVTVKPTLVEEVVLDRENAEMTIGDKLTLKASVLPADADDVAVSWKSLKEEVASVDSKGNVEALMEGSATIVASAGGKNAQCVITVKKPVVHVESVKITKSVSKIVEGESFVFEAVVTPADATDKSLTWESSDKTVLSIAADGKASALKPGKVEVIVRTTDGGKTDRCSVEVESAYVPVTKVEIMGISGVLNLKKGDTHTLAAKVYPEDATDKTIIWSVSDEKVITVDQNGKVTAVGGGKAKVTVTSKNEGKTAECEVSVVVPVKDVLLSKTSAELTEGDELELTITVNPSDATNKNVTWSSSDETVAKVMNGKVTALKPGSAKITVTTEDGGKKAECAVTVVARIYPVTGITLNKTSAELTEGDELVLTATIAPSNATNKNVIWSSSNEDVAKVVNGKVTAMKAGVAKITVTTEDGGKKAECAVTVVAKIYPVTGVTLDKTSAELTEGDELVLTATIVPSNATNKNVTWSSSDETVVKVVNGKVTAMKAGSAKITVTTEDGGKKAECAVTVVAKTYPVTGVTLDKTSVELTEGDELQLVATVTPSNATNKNVTWSSSDETVAKVVGGKVTALKTGVAKITVTTSDGGKTAECTVAVIAKTYPVTGVALDKTSAELTEGDELVLTATITPSNATNKNVIWSSSDETVAKVVGGKVTALKAGVATITVTTSDGGKKAECAVTVIARTYPVTGVALDKTSAELTEGDELVLTAAITPSNATNKNVTWSSNDETVAKVVSGKVTALKAGVAKITVTTSDGGKTASCDVTVKPRVVNVTSVEISSSPANLSMLVGDEFTFAAKVLPENATDKSVAWKSSATNVISIDGTGKAKALAPGQAVITVTSTDGGKSASVTVKVSSPVVDVTSIEITTKPSSNKMTVGDSFTFTATVKPDNATDKTVKWNSSNTSVLSIDPSTGKATAKAAGNSTITVKSADEKVKAEVFVTVVSPESTGKVTGLTLSTENGVDFVRHGKTIQLIPNYSPIGAYPAEAKWFSSNPEMATVDQSGLVKAISFNYSQSHLHYSQNGYPEVTISLQADGLMAIFKLKILPAVPEKIIVQNPPPSTMTIGDTWDMGQITIIPAEAEQSVNINYRYETGNSQGFTGGGPSSFVAEYDVPLNIQIQANGTHAQAVYTGTDINYHISVKPIYETSIKMINTSYTLEKGAMLSLLCDIKPINASYHDLTWEVSNPSVAEVDKGLVIAKSNGTATVTARTHHGLTASCTITVKDRTSAVQVGDFYYSDGTTSSELISGKTPVGIVFSLLDASGSDPYMAKEHAGCTHGLVVGLKDHHSAMSMGENANLKTLREWAIDNGYPDFMYPGDIILLQNASGYDIRKYYDSCIGYSASKAHKKYKEVKGYVCNVFADNGALDTQMSDAPLPSSTSGWYFPTISEMALLADNYEIVNNKLKMISSADQFKSGTLDRYWTNTYYLEGERSFQYSLSTSDFYKSLVYGNTYQMISSGHSNVYRVRFIFAF